MAVADTHPRSPVQAMMRFGSWVYFVVFFTVLYSPLLSLFADSFSEVQSKPLSASNFTLKWYGEVLGDSRVLHALFNSVGLGIVAGAISTALALSASFGIRNSRLGQSILIPLILVPIILPGIIGGVVLLILFGYLQVPFTIFTTVLVAHVNWCLPFAFLTIYPLVQQLDAALEEAAADLGAGPLDILVKVIFPQLRPAIISTFLFGFTLSFDEFVRTLFVIGTETTLPVRIWVLVNDEVSPSLPAMSVLIILISIAVSLAGFATSARTSR